MRRRIALLAVEILTPVALFTAWWFLSADSTNPFLPPLQRMVEVFRVTWTSERFVQDVIPSLVRFGSGFLIATILGVAVGLLLGLWQAARRATTPMIDFLRSIPAPALISVMIILFGFGDGMKITAIAFAAFFPVLLNTIDGVRGVEPLQLEMSKAYKLKRSDEVLKIVIPAASPQIFVGLRISLAVALAVMAFAEMFAGTDGLGFFIIFAQATYRVAEMYSGVFVLGLLGYAVTLVFLFVERRVLKWHRGWRATTQVTGGMN
jgi:ABC-type nitrate/sulfonate/bicarbonate transport system permease component